MLTTDKTTALDETRTPEQIRADFPILAREVHGKPLVYLDSTASSQKPQSVIDAMDTYYKMYNANVHRGVYELSESATEAMEQARRKVARFIHARQSKQVIFTRNTTESINLVVCSWGNANIAEGDLIVLTEMEHHSNLVPWQLLAQRTGARLEFIPVNDEGLLRLDVYAQLLEQRPKLVAFTHMSNVLGTITPAQEMIAQAHTAGAIVLLDAAQSVPHLPVDVQMLDVDFLCFSGHKMLGPTGIGVLYGKRELLEAMPPFMGGGDMIRHVGLRESTWNDLPWKFEAGTPAIAEAIGLGVAIDYLNNLGMEWVMQHEREMTVYAMEQLRVVPNLTIYGPDASQRGGVLSFTLGDIHPHDLASILDQEAGVAIRAGHHCAQPLHERYDLSATARAASTCIQIRTILIRWCWDCLRRNRFSVFKERAFPMSMDYREYILDHYRNPRNYGKLDTPDVHSEASNQLSGDQLAMDLQVEGDHVTEVRFRGRGCAISQASASMLSEMIEGKTVEEVIKLGKDDVLEALGVPISPARTKCAFLSLRVLHSGLARAGLEKPIESQTESEEE